MFDLVTYFNKMCNRPPKSSHFHPILYTIKENILKHHLVKGIVQIYAGILKNVSFCFLGKGCVHNCMYLLGGKIVSTPEEHFQTETIVSALKWHCLFT